MIVHVVANVLIPVIANHAPFKLPQIVEPAFWRHTAVLFVGYIVVISAFFFVRRSVLKGGH